MPSARSPSHAGSDFEALPIQQAEEIVQCLEPGTTVVAIDEAQFFDSASSRTWFKTGRPGMRVIVAGLDIDFRGEPFGPIPVLMALAERVDKLQAICMVCGESASRTQRLVNGEPADYHDPVVIVGAAEIYEARCRKHHEVAKEVKMQDYHEFLAEVLVTEEQIQKRVVELGAQISRDYQGKELILVCILRGGVLFLTDLMRQITVPHMLDFMSVSSYGVGARRSSGQSRINLDVRTDLRQPACAAGGRYCRQRLHHQGRDRIAQGAPGRRA